MIQAMGLGMQRYTDITRRSFILFYDFPDMSGLCMTLSLDFGCGYKIQFFDHLDVQFPLQVDPYNLAIDTFRE